MKNIFLLFLCLAIDPFNLDAQKTINGIIPGQIDNTNSPGYNPNCDTIFSFSTINQIPVGLAFDGSNLYTASQSHEIYKFNLNGQLTDSIPYPGLSDVAGEMDFDGVFLWVVVEQEGRIYKLSPSSGDIITSFALPSSNEEDPNNYGCAYDNGYIWITEYIDKTLMRINQTTGTLVDSFVINRSILPIKIIRGDLYGIEFGIPSGDHKLLKFDKSTGAVIDSLPWCLNEPLGLTMANEHIWGLSSGLFSGTHRIYEFQNILSGEDNTIDFNKDVTVFPNPASNKITISSTGIFNQIVLYNAIGIKVFSKSELNSTIPYEMDVSVFQKGIYFISIYNGVRTYIEKIVIE